MTHEAGSGGPPDPMARQIVTPAPSRGPIQIQMPERIPWSILGPEFLQVWGRADPKKPKPEHMEILGPNGSGKTYFQGTVMQQRAALRGSAIISVVTKPDDDSIPLLGWPMVENWRGVKENRQCVFWPQTKLLGTARTNFLAQTIQDLLDRLWVPKANVVLQFDEIDTVEGLSIEVKARIRTYWRECRALGITIMAGKQRPQGIQREMHSETPWTAAFQPADEDDMERFAQLFGPKRIWMEVFRNLDPSKREFVFRNQKTKECYITWVDTELKPIKAQNGQGTTLWTPSSRKPVE